MSKLDDDYVKYLRWCLDNRQPPLNPLQYQKAQQKLEEKKENESN